MGNDTYILAFAVLAFLTHNGKGGHGEGVANGKNEPVTDKSLETKRSKEIILIISRTLPSAPPEAQQL